VTLSGILPDSHREIGVKETMQKTRGPEGWVYHRQPGNSSESGSASWKSKCKKKRSGITGVSLGINQKKKAGGRPSRERTATNRPVKGQGNPGGKARNPRGKVVLPPRKSDQRMKTEAANPKGSVDGTSKVVVDATGQTTCQTETAGEPQARKKNAPRNKLRRGAEQKAACSAP